MAAIALHDQAERTVQVKREQLIAQLTSNREKHLADYKIALAGYKEAAKIKLIKGHEDARASLDKNLKRGLEDLDAFDSRDPRKQSDYLALVIGVNVEMKVPRNYTSQYDAAIDMANWDVRETLELTHAEFQYFVRDVWDWTNDFYTTNATYSMG